MAEQVTREEIMGLGVLAGLTGVGLIVAASADAEGPLAPLKPGESLGEVSCPTLDARGAITVARGSLVTVWAPRLPYQGPGRDTYSVFEIEQRQGGRGVVVYSSGVAGVHVGPSATMKEFPLVSPDQPQPDGSTGQALTAYPFPGVFELVDGEKVLRNPICGAPAVLGLATARIYIYERARPEDADGFSSPTCNKRREVGRRRWPEKIRFV